MPTDVLMNPATKKQLDAFIHNPSHALLLIGPRGAGKKFLAQFAASKLLGVPLEKLPNHPFFIIVETPEAKQNIPIEAIRGVVKSLGLKVPSSGTNRVVVIFNAQLMTVEAQNAFLKSLEEPPAGTIFILTADNNISLLPTIISRTTRINVRPLGLKEATSFFDNDETSVQAAWRLSQGYVGLLASLLNSDEHALKSAVNQAKTFLAKDAYQRLLELDSLSSDKEQFDNFLLGLAKVIQALYKNSAGSGNAAQTSRLTKAMTLILQSRQDLSLNISARLIALKLALNLSV